MSLFKTLGIAIFIVAFILIALGSTPVAKGYFAVGIFGISLMAIPENYGLTTKRLFLWSAMIFVLIFFSITSDVLSFIMFVVFIFLAKIAGLEFNESSDNDHWDYD